MVGDTLGSDKNHQTCIKLTSGTVFSSCCSIRFVTLTYTPKLKTKHVHLSRSFIRLHKDDNVFVVIPGAVPVATLNLQRGVKPGWTIPDAWHHQMVYGVSSKGNKSLGLTVSSIINVNNDLWEDNIVVI